MSIACIRDRKELEEIAPEWNRLLAESKSDSIFLSWEWISTWWDVFGGLFQMRVLLDRDEKGCIHGIAPLMIGKERIFGKTFRSLMIIGQKGDTLAEYLDLFVRAGCEKEITNRFAEYIKTELRNDWDLIFFERVVQESPNLDLLRTALQGAKIDNELKSPSLKLLPTWDELLATKSRNFRSQWNNSWNRLMKQGKVEFLFAGKDVPLEKAMGEVARLHRQRWGDQSNSFKTEKYLGFHNQLARKLFEKQWLVLMLIAVDGEYVAARYDFAYGGKVWCIQGGWNDAYDSMRVGTILTGKVIEWGIENSQREYDFLGGDSEYKRRWSDGERTMVNLTAPNTSTLRGRLYQLFNQTKTAKQTLKNRMPDKVKVFLRRFRGSKIQTKAE